MDWIFAIAVTIIILTCGLFYDSKYQLKRELEIKNKKEKEMHDMEKEKQVLEDIVRSKLPNVDDKFYIEGYYSNGNIILLPNEKIYHVFTDNKKFRMSIIEENGQPTLYKWIQIKD